MYARYLMTELHLLSVLWNSKSQKGQRKDSSLYVGTDATPIIPQENLMSFLYFSLAISVAVLWEKNSWLKTMQFLVY